MKNWAEAARLIGITRARMTQIANLMLLAPEIQEAILILPPVLDGAAPVSEHDLREIGGMPDWHKQHPGKGEVRIVSSL
jgi:hypothetical protein